MWNDNHSEARVLVQNLKSGLYFAVAETWTEIVEQALDFESRGRASAFIQKRGLKTARIIQTTAEPVLC